MTHRSRTTGLRLAFIAALSLVLAACGGGTASIGGTLSGLPSGATITLQNKGTDSLTLSANGSFTFATEVDANATYSVTVLTQPAGATCTVANASGTVSNSGDDVSNVVVTCVSTASIGGTVSGLVSGTAVTLLNNGGSALAIAANGAFAFPGTVSTGTTYNVTVGTQPSGHTCTVSGGSGTYNGTATAITVSCV